LRLTDVPIAPQQNHKVPNDWRPSATWDGQSGEITSEALTGEPNFEQLLIDHGHDPEQVEVIGSVRTSRWQVARKGGQSEWLTSFRFNIQRKVNAETVNLPALFAEARRTKIKTVPTRTGEALVVVWADPQTGKVDHRGGTPELILRVQEKLAKLETYIKTQKTSTAYFLNAGDSIEGFENVESQSFTNDLSLMEQIDLEATFEWSFLRLLRKHHNDVTSATVGSNHCAWRKGKNSLGRPSDDWGLFIQRQHQKLNDELGMGMKFAEPETYSESLALDINGTIVGLVHGHQAASGKFSDFWAKQIHGGSALSACDVVVSGHYHTLSIQPTGRNPYTGKSKWHLQAPTMDNGSSWWANKAGGSDSDPGLLVFTIGNEGLNLQSLAVL
jgi:hypothetical protein